MNVKEPVTSLPHPRNDFIGSAVQGLKSLWDSFRIAAWLGWQIESNWTDPFLFAVYSLVKPLASVMILVVMYGVITKGFSRAHFFPICI
jgi:hypothetical protein